VSTCARCGKEANSIVNCSGKAVCHECCRRCFHYNNEISVLHCREAAFFNQLLQAGINITPEGRIYMAKESYTVIIPPYKPAYVAKVKSPDNTRELINNKISLKPKSISCHIRGNHFRVIVPAETKGMAANEKATSIANEDVRGSAMVVINNYGSFIGMTKSAAQFIASKINEFNSEEIIDDVRT
jgi:hypothetical protein